MSKAVEIIAGVALIAAGPLGWAVFSSTSGALLLGGATGAVLGGMATSIGVSLILSAAAQVFGPKPPHSSPLGSGIDVAYSGTLEPRRIIYGKLKVSGMNAIPPMTSGANNDYFHQVLVLAGHPINSIGDVYFGQIRIPSANIGSVTGGSGDGLVSGIPAPPTGQVNGQPYNNLAWIRRYAGAQTAADYILTNAFVPWDLNHKGLELTYLALQFKFDQNAYSGGVPAVTAIVQGKKIYDPRLDTTNGGSGSQRYTDPTTWTYSTNPALCLRDYLTSSLGLGEAQTRMDDVLVAAAANKCDESCNVPIPVLVGLTTWTNGSAVVNGINTAFQAVLAATNYVKAPNGTMYQVSTVDSDVQLHLTVSYPGTSATGQVTQYNTANSASTTQKRYTCNTALDATGRFEDNIATLANAMQGHCLYSGGKWRMYAGGWSGSAFTLTESDLVGSVSIQCSTPRKDLYNSVRGNFLDPQQNYQPSEFPAIANSTFITEDGGETIYLETSFPCCSDSFEAQRNAIALVEQSRNRHVVTAQYGMSAFGVKVWETGVVTIAEVGWNGQTVRCLSWKFLPQGMVELALQEAYAADWTDPAVTDYSVSGVNIAPQPQRYLPYPPTSLTIVPVAGGITFQVALPGQLPAGTGVEILEYTASTPASSAVVVAGGVGDTFTIPKTDTITRYYWARTYSPFGRTVYSPTYPATTGLAGAALPATNKWIPVGNMVVDSIAGVAWKEGGSSAWDSAIYTAQGHDVCHVTAKIGSPPASMVVMIGLSDSPTSTPNYTNADYAWYANAGSNWQIYESGSNPATFPGTNYTDTVIVTYDTNDGSGNVRYYLNGALVRTVAAGTGRTFFGFCPFDYPGSILTDLEFGPTTLVGITDTAQVRDGAVSQILGTTGDDSYVLTTNSASAALSNIWDHFNNIQLSINVVTGPVAIDLTMTNIRLFFQSGITDFTFSWTVFRDSPSSGSGTGSIGCPSAIYLGTTAAWHPGSDAEAYMPPGTITYIDTSVTPGTHTYRLVYSVSCTGGASPHYSMTAILHGYSFKLREIKK